MSHKINVIVIVVVLSAVLLFGAGNSFAAASIVVETGAATPVVSIGKTHQVTARVLLKPISVSAKARAPIAAALVIDKSGSMRADGKIENAKRGAIEALKLLDARDVAAVITYDSEAFVLAKAGAVNNMAYFTKSISRLRADGNTALYDGVRLGAKEIERFLESGYVPRIILLSDGLANVGPSSVSELASFGHSLARRGITITTIGLGLDYDEDLMTALAAKSGGNAYFARTIDRLEDIFRRDMEDAVAITGRSVRVTLSCEDDTRPIRSIGRAGKISAKEIVVDIDNLYGAEKYAIFELEVPASEIESVVRACVIKVEYTDAVTGMEVALESHLDIEYSANEDYVRKQRNAEIAVQAEISRNAEIIEQVVELSDSGKSKEALALIKERVENLSSSEYESAEPVQKHISYFGSLTEDISKAGRMSNERRKSSVNQVYSTKNQQTSVSRRDNDK